ncbi:MAG TPA: hypothetical protein VHH73_09330 [Verrucomicrobiae bacterium]|nr:hypothetical protein [Verrucomicrobiae bacterium]
MTRGTGIIEDPLDPARPNSRFHKWGDRGIDLPLWFWLLVVATVLAGALWFMARVGT